MPKRDRSMTKIGRSGIRGVYQTKWGSFTARVKVDGLSTHLGTFDTAEEAAQAIEDAKREMPPSPPSTFGELLREQVPTYWTKDSVR